MDTVMGADRRYAAVIILTVATALSGCSGQVSPTGARGGPSVRSTAAAGHYATDALTAQVQHSGAQRAYLPATLTAALPSVTYKLGDTGVRTSTLVATGSFTSWRSVPAIVDNEEPDAGSTSPAWRVLIVHFRVDHIVARSAEGSQVTVGDSLPVELYVSPGADPAKVGDGLVALGPSIAFLTGGFRGGTNNWDIALEGALLGTVDSAGNITMQIDRLSSGGTDTVNGIRIDATTVAALELAAQVPVTIPLRPSVPSSPSASDSPAR